MTARPTLGDVVEVVETLYRTSWAGEDDAVGLAVGEPDAPAGKVLLAVDPVGRVIAEAVEHDADLVITHHPLLYRPVHTVSAATPKGRVIHDLISHQIGLYVAHSNADSPALGVSESLALALGLRDLLPLRPHAADPLDKLVTFVPTADAERLLEALAAAGAGVVGDYDRCAFLVDGRGTFRPGSRAQPTVGTRGLVEVVAETRLELVLPRSRRDAVVRALRAAHPYEEPAFDVVELSVPATDRGSGRLGRLPEPVPLREFADTVARSLPATSTGARVGGDLDAVVSTVAVLAGAGGDELARAREAGVDVYVTSDLRHHPASEFLEYAGAPALIDVPHWAAEWTWLPVAERAITAGLADRGWQVETRVSRVVTDPWSYRAPSGTKK